MRKVFSILFIISITAAGLRVTVSSHFCGGMLAGTIVSFSGKHASCGMEGTEENCPYPWHELTGKCCEDHLRITGSVNNFTAHSPYSEVLNRADLHLQTTTVYGFSGPPLSYSRTLTGYEPPGIWFPGPVNPESICILRI